MEIRDVVTKMNVCLLLVICIISRIAYMRAIGLTRTFYLEAYIKNERFSATKILVEIRKFLSSYVDLL